MTSQQTPPDPTAALVERARHRTVVMWTAIALSLALAVVLMSVGWGENAWSIAALALLLSCFAVCAWAFHAAQRDLEDGIEQAKQFVAQRQRELGARRATPAGPDGPSSSSSAGCTAMMLMTMPSMMSSDDQ
jgi:hypothetical protein